MQCFHKYVTFDINGQGCKIHLRGISLNQVDIASFFLGNIKALEHNILYWCLHQRSNLNFILSLNLNFFKVLMKRINFWVT